MKLRFWPMRPIKWPIKTVIFVAMRKKKGGDLYLYITNDQGTYLLGIKDAMKQYEAVTALQKGAPMKFDLEINHIPSGDKRFITTSKKLFSMAFIIIFAI
jgi:hypothetical protein